MADSDTGLAATLFVCSTKRSLGSLWRGMRTYLRLCLAMFACCVVLTQVLSFDNCM